MLAQRQVINGLTAIPAIAKRVGHTADYGEPGTVGSFAKAAPKWIHVWEKLSCKGGIHHCDPLRTNAVPVSKTTSLQQSQICSVKEIRRDHPRGNQRMILFTRIRSALDFDRPHAMPESESVARQGGGFNPRRLIQIPIQFLENPPSILYAREIHVYGQHRFWVKGQAHVIKVLALADEGKGPDQDDQRGGDLGNYEQPLESRGAQMGGKERLAL